MKMKDLLFDIIEELKEKFDVHIYSVDDQPVLKFKTHKQFGEINKHLLEKYELKVSDVFYMHHKE